MAGFIGEFPCKIDDKGRFILPAAIKKQMPVEAKEKFVLNRGFEKCLVLYPQNEWEIISDKINKLNKFVKRNREFARYFFRGATEMTLDTASRLLIPKRLADYADIKKDIILSSLTDKIEVWAMEHYDNMLGEEPENFSDLAEEVMGGE
ncbi:MAG: division/cell wall cluster transcriptional repressor MraZ [Bacteroidetes bacterium]|nr:division/cell wall cluster transcriptional repressor MraZ [Bacteroidota bacterium]